MKKIEFTPMTKFKEQLLIQNEFIESIVIIDNTVSELADLIEFDVQNFRNFLTEKIEKFLKLYRQRVNFFVSDLRRFVSSQAEQNQSTTIQKIIKKFGKNLEKIKRKNDILGAELKRLDQSSMITVIKREFKFLKSMIFPKIEKIEEDILKRIDKVQQHHLNNMRFIEEIEDLEMLSRRRKNFDLGLKNQGEVDF